MVDRLWLAGFPMSHIRMMITDDETLSHTHTHTHTHTHVHTQLKIKHSIEQSMVDRLWLVGFPMSHIRMMIIDDETLSHTHTVEN